MTLPLVVLAVFSILLGFVGTPVWPWFQAFLSGEQLGVDFSQIGKPDFLSTVLLSTAVVFIGLGAGYWLYGRQPLSASEQPDAVERLWPNVFTLLRRKYFVDEAYEWAIVGLNAFWARTCDWLDRWIWDGLVQLFSYLALGFAWLDRSIDEFVINLGFDQACKGLSQGGKLMSLLQNGRVQHYLRLIGVALIALTLFLVWGCAS
jgi:NADH-quinone oxidoreductase subunit L